jgi:hypothetical protein
MTRPAWLETVAEICGGELEGWREIGAYGGTWRWRDEDDTERRWLADDDSVWHEGGGLWVEARCSGGEVDHARLARAVLAGLAVARGDLDVDALQRQVATLTRERDELAAGPDWRELHALRAFASRVQAAHATPGCEREPVRLSSLPLLAERVEGVADRLAGALETIERVASAAGCPDVEPADLPARVAVLAGSVGSLARDPTRSRPSSEVTHDRRGV